MGSQPDHPTESAWEIKGTVQTDERREPVGGARVLVYDADSPAASPLAEGKTDAKGRYQIRLREHAAVRSPRLVDPYVVVEDARGRPLLSTAGLRLRLRGQTAELGLAVAEPTQAEGPQVRPGRRVKVGSLEVDALELERADPELILEVARTMVDPRPSEKTLERIALLSPDLVPQAHVSRTLCGTAILETLDAIVKIKKWPREVALEIDHILAMREFGFGESTYECPNFVVTYQTSGPAAVPPDTSAQDVVDPGTNPPQVIGTLPAGGVPTYVKRVCFWLERALKAYVDPPFSLLNPAAGGKIPVVINSAPYGSASSSGTFYLNNNLNADLLCAVAVHELFHMVQYGYGGSGPWRQSVFEGGAVFAEDTVADKMNRYLDEAGTNFNGTGTQSNPNLSLAGASYKCALFWRYVAEQQSSDVTEPFVGVETYRKIIEKGSTGGYTTNDVRQAIRELPWHQDLYEMSYLDPAREDLTRAETTFGNYALACYLKELGTDVPDRRFEFMEDEENIYIDEVIPGAPLQTTLAPPTVSGAGTLTPGSSVSFAGTVNSLATRYYEVTLDAGVTNVDVAFAAGAGLTSRLFQVVLLDQDGKVRDIHRTDKATYAKRITNLRDGKALSRIVLVVSGCESAGPFTLSASPASPAPDVMVTRWHSKKMREYEIDSFGWAWHWVSPDVWVDNDGDGVADGQVFFNHDNKLHVRLHNKGNAPASGIGVQLWYQDASGGLSHAAWLPVRNKAGAIQTLSGLSLAAGASQAFVVDWSPTPSGASQHFCIKAVVAVPGDPNTDNKRVLSNFGNVIAGPFARFDLTLLRRNLKDLRAPVRLRVVPRTSPEYEIAMRDLVENETVVLEPGEARVDHVRVTRRKLEGHVRHVHNEKQPKGRGRLVPSHGESTPARLELRPDPRRTYATDPDSLPPGVAGRPMVTVLHEVDGVPVGGVTYLLTPEESAKKKGRAPEPVQARPAQAAPKEHRAR